VLVAALVLSTLAVAVGTLAAHGRAGLALQRHRQVALAIAHSRLEEVRAAPFASIRPAVSNLAASWYLSRGAGGWAVSASDPGEVRQANVRSFPLVTQVQWVDADGGASSFDAVRVRVSVRVRAGAGDEVVLESWRAPGGTPP
jgi:hypothetical protein